VLRSSLSRSCLVLLIGWFSVAQAASPPSETLFPNTTKGWLSVPNVETMRENFRLTQLGELINDEAMAPFVDDLGKQLEDKFADAGVKLGVTLADLEGVYGGEVAIGAVRPDAKDVNSHALAITVDITGREREAGALLDKIAANMAAKGAKRAVRRLGTTEVIDYTIPAPEAGRPPRRALYAIRANTLVASDNESTLVGILTRLEAPGADMLESLPAYRQVAAKVHGMENPMNAHVRWFVQPLDYAELVRAASGGRQRRGADRLAILRRQGFDAIHGIGGRVQFHAEEHELYHRSYAYAPPVMGAPAGQRFRGAANMLDFPNSENLDVQPWVPASVSSYFTYNWQIQKAFKHFGGLFDAFTEEGTWEEIMVGLARDPAGPEVDIEKELIAQMGQRVTVITDYRLPITPKSERVLVGIELNPADPMAAAKAKGAIRKLMEAEPDARRIEVEGAEAWEVAERQEEAEIPILNIDGPGFVAFEGTGEKEEVAVALVAPDAEKPISWVITVAREHVFIATHVDILTDVLVEKAPADQLATAADLGRVREAMTKLGSGDDSFRFFSRTDEAYRPTYELVRKGLMPEAETVLGRLLNQAFPAPKGELRKPAIDGKKLPAFEAVVDYLGPAGAFVQTEAEGWLVQGALLTKGPAAERPVAEVAEKKE
jgi:hypothetical protein